MILPLKLFIIFFKVGIFMFGGGYSGLPMMRRELVGPGRFMTAEEFSSMVAVAEVTPGPVAVNIATYCGYRKAGLFGAVCSTAGVVLPAFISILALAAFIAGHIEKPVFRSVTAGLSAGVISLISFALYQLAVTGIRTGGLKTVGLASALFALLFAGLHPAYVIIIAGAAGYFFHG